jgi:putative Holliday junction resolvase
VGKVRVGIAISDVHGILASPLITLDRTLLTTSFESLFGSVEEFVGLLEIYVSLPLNMQGSVTPSTLDAVDFAEQLSKATKVPLLFIDERLTTSLSNAQLRNIGKSQKDARSTIDQMSAVAILEYAFQVERNSGERPGLSLEEWRRANE